MTKNAIFALLPWVFCKTVPLLGESYDRDAGARAHINARARHYANLASCACVHAPYTPYKVPRWYTVFIFPRMPENYFYATNVSCTHRGKIMTHLFDLLSNDVYVRFYLFLLFDCSIMKFLSDDISSKVKIWSWKIETPAFMLYYLMWQVFDDQRKELFYLFFKTLKSRIEEFNIFVVNYS